MKSLIYFCLMNLLILSGCGFVAMEEDKPMEEAIENMDIDEAIQLVKDKFQKEMLTRYKADHSTDSDISVTEYDAYFEIIISHASFINTIGERYSGGAEQVFLDKKTGRASMGWHEHPMKIPEVKDVLPKIW